MSEAMATDRYTSIMDYCERMSMSYSYKPVLILALINNGGQIDLDGAASFFLRYYSSRLEQGLIAEKSNSIYSNLHCSFDQVKQNIRNNPVKALISSSDYFLFDSKSGILFIEPSLLASVAGDKLAALQNICVARLERYFNSIAVSETSNITAFHDPQDVNGFLSNDYEAAFSITGISFSSMTQYMFYRKALIFGDEALGRYILSTHETNKLAKIAFRSRWPMNPKWDGQKQIVAYKGLLAKFAQNENLSSLLLDTGNSVIAACLSEDSVWGNGLDVIDKRVSSIDKWPGKNMLGFTLMQVRNALYSTRTF